VYDWVIDQIRRREQEREQLPLQLPVYDDPPPRERPPEEEPAPRGVVIIDL
jgi:hypothetical protein